MSLALEELRIRLNRLHQERSLADVKLGTGVVVRGRVWEQVPTEGTFVSVEGYVLPSGTSSVISVRIADIEEIVPVPAA